MPINLSFILGEAPDSSRHRQERKRRDEWQVQVQGSIPVRRHDPGVGCPSRVQAQQAARRILHRRSYRHAHCHCFVLHCLLRLRSSRTRGLRRMIMEINSPHGFCLKICIAIRLHVKKKLVHCFLVSMLVEKWKLSRFIPGQPCPSSSSSWPRTSATCSSSSPGPRTPPASPAASRPSSPARSRRRPRRRRG